MNQSIRERFIAQFEHLTNKNELWSFIETLLEEARQEMKEKCLACIPIVSGRTLLEYEENGGAIASKIKDSILSL